MEIGFPLSYIIPYDGRYGKNLCYDTQRDTRMKGFPFLS
jgi:hypothetical protein